MFFPLRLAVPLLVLLVPQLVHASCGASVCLLNTDWAVQGAWQSEGLRMDLRVDYTDQSRLQAGSRKAPESVGPVISERELATETFRTTARVGYGLANGWSVAADLPLIQRKHSHRLQITGEPVSWDYTQLGDVALSVTRQLALQAAPNGDARVAGFTLGLQLPTGKTDVRNATRTQAEPSLQPGTGVTELRAGWFYRHINPADGRSWFVHAQGQAPIQSDANYEPGARFNVDAGLALPGPQSLTWLAQLGLLHTQREKGLLSDPNNSGGDFVSVSPGAAYALDLKARLYGFLQLPVYAQVNGRQLVPQWGITLGYQQQF